MLSPENGTIRSLPEFELRFVCSRKLRKGLFLLPSAYRPIRAGGTSCMRLAGVSCFHMLIGIDPRTHDPSQGERMTLPRGPAFPADPLPSKCKRPSQESTKGRISLGGCGALLLTPGVCRQGGCYLPDFWVLQRSHWLHGLADPPKEKRLGICLRRGVL